MTKIKNSLNTSARLLNEEAVKRGIACEILNENTLLMRKNGVSWYTCGSRSSIQSSVGKTIADRKEVAKIVLQRFGFPTASFVVLKSPDDSSLLSQLNFPVAIKPSQGNQGRGVIVGISSVQETEQYLSDYLYDTDNFVLAEEMLSGKDYRILCINYRFFAAIERKPAYVVGDGVHTIDELIAQKNTHPLRGDGYITPYQKIKVDSFVEQYLQEQGFTTSFILPAGKEVMLRKVANVSMGGEPIDCTDAVCQENKELFEKIAHACDLNTIGIDVMCDNLSQPLREQKNSGVVEVNASPGLSLHHFPIKGTPRYAAKEILNMIEKLLKIK